MLATIKKIFQLENYMYQQQLQAERKYKEYKEYKFDSSQLQFVSEATD